MIFPFAATTGSSAIVEVLDILPALLAVLVLLVILWTVLASMGDRLLVRALRSSGASYSSTSASSVKGWGVAALFFADERVTGPKYSRSGSEGVGLGEMTRGVSGTDCFPRKDMVSEKGGRAGQRTAPTTMRRRDWKAEGQARETAGVVEWRCLSRREERVSSSSSSSSWIRELLELRKSENRFQVLLQ